MSDTPVFIDKLIESIEYFGSECDSEFCSSCGWCFFCDMGLGLEKVHAILMELYKKSYPNEYDMFCFMRDFSIAAVMSEDCDLLS